GLIGEVAEVAGKGVFSILDVKCELALDVVEVVIVLREITDIQFQERLDRRHKMKPEVQIGIHNRGINGDQREKMLPMEGQWLGEHVLERRKWLQIGLRSSNVLDHGATFP